jgi:hypothetical protein
MATPRTHAVAPPLLLIVIDISQQQAGSSYVYIYYSSRNLGMYRPPASRFGELIAGVRPELDRSTTHADRSGLGPVVRGSGRWMMMERWSKGESMRS